MAIERYVEQLLADIAYATENVAWPYRERESDILSWVSDEDEERTAPRRPLEDWTGIRKAELPPVDRLSDDQVHRLLEAQEHFGVSKRTAHRDLSQLVTKGVLTKVGTTGKGTFYALSKGVIKGPKGSRRPRREKRPKGAGKGPKGP